MRPDKLLIGGVIYWVITTRDPDTQVLKDADSTPTVAIRKNGASTADSVTIAKRAATTGIYDCEYNPAGEVEGDSYTVEESATVTGTTTGAATYTNSWAFGVVAVERGTDGANTVTPPTNDEISQKIATDIENGDNNWDFAVPTLAVNIWSHVITGTTSAATAVTNLLSRIIGTLAAGTHQPQTGDSFARLGAPDGASIAADIAAIDGGGGGGSVNVLPAVGIVADRSPGATITPVVGETISQSITLYATDGTTAISLVGKTLAIVFETLQGADVAVVLNASIAVSGTGSNVVTFAYPSVVTSSERTLRFAIRDAGAPLTMYLQGLCVVTRAPQVD